jgi:hypothetical protein
LELQQAFSLISFIGNDSEAVQAISRFKGTDQTDDDVNAFPVILLKCGVLHMIWKSVTGLFELE